MKVSYKWLKKFVDFNLSPCELTEMLISIGIESFVVSNTYDWCNVVTAKILEVKKCQVSDDFFLCKLSDGSKEYSIVCSAKNIAVGQVVPLAKIGAVLPKNLKIKKSMIRGLISEGMLCSEFDLGLKEKSEGVLILASDTKIGVAFENVLEESDSIIEVEIPTNRGDCLSYLGIAREVVAKLRKNQHTPIVKTFDVPKLNCVEVKSNLCSRYIGTLISGIKIAQSPNWILNILEKSGIRSVNNVVDVTNYVMLELGQPLHAFDMGKLSSKKIVIREATNFEKILALDDKEYELDSEMLVIADDKIPIAIAGIMGGKYSSIDEKTESVFLESAIFNPGLIRRTSKKLNLSTDSSYRFERGVSWDTSDFASWRAANLIIEVAGGKVKSREDFKILQYEKKNVSLRFGNVSKILGISIEKNEIMEILRYLGIISQEKGGVIICAVPSWRNDIKEEIDLIGEIVRIKGYDALLSATKTHKNSLYVQSNSFFPSIVGGMRTKLNILGFSEVLNYSFSEIRELEKFDLKYSYRVANPISKENEVLRPSLLPSLYRNILLNVLHGSEKVALFEYGKVFNEFGEKKAFAVIMCGKIWKEWWKWSEKKIVPKYDFYFGGGIIKYILPSNEFTIVKNFNFKSYYHPGKTAAITYNEKLVGQFGILKSSITNYDNINDDIFYFEIDLELIKNNCRNELNTVCYKSYSKFPVLKRDISVIADRSVEFSKIEQVIKNIMETGGILREYSLFSVYSNAHKLGACKVSYSFKLVYRSYDKTLTDEEVNKDMTLLLEKLDRNLNIKLR